jgi:hypothetical protein
MTEIQAVTKITDEIVPIEEQVESFEIKTNDDFIKAGEVLRQVKAKEKIVKAQKEKLVKPSYDAYVNIRDAFKPAEEQLKKIEATLKKKMTDYQTEVDKQAKIEEARLQKKIEGGYITNPETIVRNIEKINTVSAEEAGVKTVMQKKVRVIDWAKVPADYLTRPKVMEAVLIEIRKDVLGNKSLGIDPIDVAGVEVYEEPVMRV